MSKRLIRHPFIQALLARLIGLYLRLIWYTTRWSLVGAEHIDMKSGGPVILAFWHECLPLAAQGWRLMVQQAPEAAGRKAEALISRHRGMQATEVMTARAGSRTARPRSPSSCAFPAKPEMNDPHAHFVRLRRIPLRGTSLRLSCGLRPGVRCPPGGREDGRPPRCSPRVS